ncbi:MAG: enoyl-CoA hydratase [Pseudomonadota bacterium]
MSEHIIVETTDRVTKATITRPEKKNAITQAMYAALAEAIIAYGESDEARALVITGAGDMFTSGNDLRDFSTGGDGGDDLPPVARFLNAIRDCPKPIIGAVNGGAIGVGLTMLLHCDLVFAAESATLSAPFVSLGLVPEAASSILLPAAVGVAVANDIFITGRTLTAEEAHRYGLVSRVIPDAGFIAAIDAVALQVANAAPNAMRRSKSLVRHQQHVVAEHMDKEAAFFTEQLKSPDFAEVIAAKMQKRAPVFQ